MLTVLTAPDHVQPAVRPAAEDRLRAFRTHVLGAAELPRHTVLEPHHPDPAP
ncbi:hypothetical protein ACFVGY_35690 [Streptomyces sp. NPDC127106]|uniref:hypothetical protein n=1 Tax=Streptomyces sp. NPDC127106 TaxID=3345360 RepID=UPI00362BF59B